MRRCLPLLTALALLWPLAGCSTVQGGRLYVSGSEALDRGDLARAITDLEQAARLVPESSEVYNHLGLAYAADGQGPAARRAFERAVALDCSNDAARRNLHAFEERAPQPVQAAVPADGS